MYNPDGFMGVMTGIVAFIVILIITIAIAVTISNRKHKEEKTVGCGIPLIISIVFSIGIGIFVSYYTGSYYKEGDYSSFECNYTNCDNPSVCKVKDNRIQYFCAEHANYGKERINRNHSTTSSKDSRTKKCPVCGREFKMGTDNSWSITTKNMCVNCYNNYKSANDLLNNMKKP